ncbi:hypothetical protein IF1G_04995 [Cordyceps javanica]|uniref:Uncharacterized protein n=1 Tax=Cordyceps javanica TaxID=43265 RepID=A0A545V3X5_9HYPO|nr:hypothetical protein IF1G_04995 [Cordyceps javanica]
MVFILGRLTTGEPVAHSTQQVTISRSQGYDSRLTDSCIALSGTPPPQAVWRRLVWARRDDQVHDASTELGKQIYCPGPAATESRLERDRKPNPQDPNERAIARHQLRFRPLSTRHGVWMYGGLGVFWLAPK